MGKRIQFVFLFLETFLSRHGKHLLFSAAAGFFGTLLLIQIYPLYLTFFGRKTEKIGIVGRFTQAGLPASLQKQISSGLTTITSDGDAQASLAGSWEADSTGTNYIFHLKQNVLWHDGKLFTARDVSYKLKGAEFSALDDYTLKVSLKEPFSPLPVILSQPIFKPNLTGTGKYKVSRLSLSEDLVTEMTLVPFTDKNLSLIQYKFYRNNMDALFAFKMGEIDILQDISDVSDLAKWKNVKVTEITRYDQFVGLFFNLRNPSFKEKEIRQALAYATAKIKDKEKAYTPISPLSWAYSQKIRLYNFDPEAAQKILGKSLLASDSSAITLSTYASLLPVAETIAENLNKIGVGTKVKVENSLPGDYQIALLAQTIPSDPDQYYLWQSTQENTNITGYSNPKIDKLLEDGRKTMDKNARKKIYADFQRYLVDDAPVIFLYYPKVFFVERK